MLSAWLARPHVRRWWHHEPSAEAVERDFGPGVDGIDPTEYLLVLEGERPIGMLQRYRIGDDDDALDTLARTGLITGPVADVMGIDYLIGEEGCIGRGLGTEMIRLAVADTWRGFPAAAAIIVDVDQGNRRSWRALERAGFRRVWSGELPSEHTRDDSPVFLYRTWRPPGSAE